MDIRELQKKTDGRRALEDELERLYVRQSELRDLLKQRQQHLEFEQSDVTELESTTLKSMFYSAIGKREERLTKEKDEAEAAKQQYEAALVEAEQVDGEIKRIELRLKELRYAESRYKKAIKDLNARITQVEPLLSDADARNLEMIRRELDKMEQHQAYYAHIREAGQELVKSLDTVVEALYEMYCEAKYVPGFGEYERWREAEERGKVVVIQTKRFQALLAEGVTLSHEYCIDPDYVDTLIKREVYRSFSDHDDLPLYEFMIPDIPSLDCNVKGILNDLEKKTERVKRHQAELERRLSALLDKYPVTE